MVQLNNMARLEEVLCSLVSQERLEYSFSVLVLTAAQNKLSGQVGFCKVCFKCITSTRVQMALS